MRVLVTGAGGFLGRALVPALRQRGYLVRASSRRATTDGAEETVSAVTPTLADDVLVQHCTGCTALIHLAAYAHEAGRSPAELTRYNTELPLRLYQAAVTAGVGRFVFVSSAKVLGNQASAPLPTTAPRAAAEPYAASKAAAEAALLAAEVSALPVTILRPPLVYGPGARANFARLLRWVTGPWPLPFAQARAPRSFVSRSNLVSALSCAITAPAGIYHVADAEPWSLAALLRALYLAQARSPRLWPLPLALLKSALKLVGQGAQAERLLAPLALDCADSYQRLGWQPQDPTQELKDTVQWFLSQR